MIDTEFALKINKFIHEQCIDGVPHDIGWNVTKMFRDEGYIKTETNKCSLFFSGETTLGICIKCGRPEYQHIASIS